MLYNSSKGPVEISTMPYPYAKNALAKLRSNSPERSAEISALDKHIQDLEIDGDANPRAVQGGNNPPEEIKPDWEAVKVHMDDLLAEARNWADGEEIDNQEKADSVASLRQLLQAAANLADKARVAEKKPFDEQIAAIQDRYNEYIAPLKNKKPGSIPKAAQVLGNLLAPWLKKLEDEQHEQEKIARDLAEKASQESLAAREAARKSDDLSAMDAADELLEVAEEAAKTLRIVENSKPQTMGALRAQGLRSKWIAIITNRRDALLHYIKEQPEAFDALIQQLADKDARQAQTRGDIPGVQWKEERVV